MTTAKVCVFICFEDFDCPIACFTKYLSLFFAYIRFYEATLIVIRFMAHLTILNAYAISTNSIMQNRQIIFIVLGVAIVIVALGRRNGNSH